MNKILLTLALAAAALPAAAQDFEGMTLSPAEGTVTELTTVTFTFPNVYDLEINSASSITATKDGAEIEGLKSKCNAPNLTVTFPEPQTAAGTYVITIDTEAICGYNEDYDYLDNPEPITATYVIEGAAEAIDFKNFTVNPAIGSMLTSLSEMTITFDNLTSLYSTGAPIVTVGDKELSAFAEEFDMSCTGNSMTLTFAETIATETATPVKILFYAGSLGGDSEEGSGMNANPIEINYTVAPEVVYDLTLEFNSPTKPDENGEISAEKQLTSFFFRILGNGYVPGNDTAEVTVTNEDGSFDAHGTIQQAYGINSSYSYFSVPINHEPLYNGKYTFHFPEGIFGDALWAADHAFGHSNEAFELEFTLVDGLQTGVKAIDSNDQAVEIFNLQGVRIDSEETTLPAGLYIIGGKKVIKK